MQFDISKFEATSPHPFAVLNIGKLFHFRQKLKESHFTMWIYEGSMNEQQFQVHMHCQSFSQGLVQIKGLQQLNTLDALGLQNVRTFLLLEQIQGTLHDGQVDILQIMRDVSQTLHDLQQQEIAVPYLIPDNIVKSANGHWKLLNLTQATNVLGMDASLSREIKGDFHYMDQDVFKASMEGKLEIVQNYFKAAVYSLGIILLEIFSHSMTQFRQEDQLKEVLIQIASEYGDQCAYLIQLMVEPTRARRPDCIELWDKMRVDAYLDVAMPKLQNKFFSNFTTSQPLDQLVMDTNEWQNHIANDSFKLTLSQNSNVESAIKIPENVKNLYKLYKQKQSPSVANHSDLPSEQGDLPDQLNQSSAEIKSDFEGSSDAIDLKRTLLFHQLKEMIQHMKILPQSQHPFDIRNDYQIDSRGRIFRCKYEGKDKVVKVFQALPNEVVLEMLINLSKIQQLKIPGVCQYDAFYIEEADVPERSYLYLVSTPIISDLDRAIKEKMLSLTQKIEIAIQMAHVLKTLNLYIHGNLKPQNILLTPDAHIKIVDFGVYDDNAEQFQNTMLTIYSPPEKMLENKLYKQSDIWSLAIIYYQMFSDKKLDESYPISSYEQAMKKFQYLDVDVPQLCPSKHRILSTLIRQMLVFDPQKRVSIDHVIHELKELLRPDELKTQQKFHPPQSPIKIVTPVKATSKIIKTSRCHSKQTLPSKDLLYIQGNSFTKKA